MCRVARHIVCCVLVYTEEVCYDSHTEPPDAVLTNPVAGTGCARCIEYERRIEVLEKQLAAWEEWEEAALLYDTRNKIRLGTATRRQRRGLPPVPGG